VGSQKWAQVTTEKGVSRNDLVDLRDQRAADLRGTGRMNADGEGPLTCAEQGG
jgi:hypothetical protein